MCDFDNSGCGSVMADGMMVIRFLLKSILHPSMGSGKLIVAYSSNKQLGGQNESLFLWESNLKRMGRS